MLPIFSAWKQHNTLIIVIVEVYFDPFTITVGFRLSICHVGVHNVNPDSTTPFTRTCPQLPLQDLMTQVTEQKGTRLLPL